MEINIDYNADPGLRIVGNFREGKLVWVRGFNGVGKTLAATILVILSGSYAFSHRREFDSLSKALKSVKVSIKIDESYTLTVKLEPKIWELVQETMHIENSSLGKFYRVEKEITAEDFQSEFQAKIVKGNETLSTQVQEMISRNIQIFKEWEQKSNKSLLLCKEFYKNCSRILQTDKLDDFESSEIEIRSLDKIILDLESKKAFAVSEVEKLSRLKCVENDIAFKNMFNAAKLADISKEYKIQIENREQNLAILEEERNNLQNRIRQEIEDKKDHYDSILQKKSTLDSEIGSLKTLIIRELEGLEISVDEDDLDLIKIESELQNKKIRASEDEKNYRRQQDQIFLKRELRTKAQSLIISLLPENDKLNNETIAEGYLENLRLKIEINVNELRSLVNNRISNIQNELARYDVDEVEKILKELHEIRLKIESISAKLVKHSKLKDSSERLQEEIRQIERDSGSNTKNVVIKIENGEKLIHSEKIQIEKIKNSLLDVEYKMARLLEMPSMPVLIKQKDELVLSLKSSNLAVQTEISEEMLKGKEEESKILQYKLMDALERKGDLELQHKLVETMIERIVDSTERSNDFSFLFQSINPELPSFKKLRIVKNSLEDFVNYVDTEIDQVISEILKALKQMLSFQQSTEAIEEYQSRFGEILERVFNNEFLAVYSRKEFMQHVFRDSAEITGFHLKENMIGLKDFNGKTVMRPISAFSSGEKAFAFALAMVSVFTLENAPHKVLFLDEFGALLDFVKENALLEELHKEVFEGDKIEKVLILLPVKTDLEKQIFELKTTIEFLDENGQEKTQKRIAELAKQLEDLTERGYFQYETEVG